MAFNKIVTQMSRLLAGLIGLALVSYIGFLVVSQYRTQVAIQDGALRQLSSDGSRRATAVSYFFSERKDDLRDLEQSRELSAYFENKALGMSLEYGLRASLIMLDDLFVKMRGTKQLSGSPIFERIVFIDASGALLADSLKAGGAAAAGSWRRYLDPKAQGPSIGAPRGKGELKFVVTAPYRFKGKYAGQIVAWISSSQVYRNFIEASGETSRYPIALVFERRYLNLPAKLKGLIGSGSASIPADIKPLIPYRLRPLEPGSAEPGGYAILVPVAGTPLSITTFVPPAEMSDLQSPLHMLYTTGGIAVFILAGMFYFQIMNTRNAVLQVHLKETILRESAVDEKNRLLAAEIEERRQTEQALRESEAKFRAIVGAVPVVIYEFRQLGAQRSFNLVADKILELAGISAEAMIADAGAFFDLIHPDDREATLAASDLASAGSGSFSQEFRIVKGDGETRWILASSLPQLGGGKGKVRYGCLEDITERKQADLSLRESRQQLLDIIAFLPDATLVVDREGRVLAWNKAIEVMTGIKAEEMIGKGNYEYALPFYGERRPILIDLALETGREEEKGYSVVHREADITYAEAFTPELGSQNCFLAATASVLRDSKGEVTAVIECIRDSTERIRAEQLLRESEATLMSMMDSMPAGVWWFDEAGEVEYLNSRFSELFGYGPEEIPTVAEWFRQAYPDPEQRAMLVAARDALMAEARLGGQPVPPQETLVSCKDGSVRHIIVNTQFSQGRTLEIFTDITEQEFIHNELLKVQKMESLGVLAGGIAHDFNNILTGIMGNVSFAQMLLEPGNQAIKPLAAAEKASLRAAELAHQLLTFAKGGQPIKKVISVPRLVAEAVSLSLRGTNVQGKLEICADLHDIEADEGQINQAFNNIVINAAHAMSGGGTLTISGENMLMESGNRFSLPPGYYVKLLFKDEGCGIRGADLENIFDPYFTTKSGGNGLGLASTLSIIRKHGGHIQVQSELGAGTTFTFYLPSTKETSQQSEPAESAEPVRHACGAVLVMDDEQVIRTLCSQLLAHLGYQVTTCANGEEAIALYADAKQKGTPYLAVIMDLTIPAGMGGKEAAQHILSYDPAARLIVSSGYSNDLALSEYGSYGFCGAVAKPYKVSELAATLEALQPRGGSARTSAGMTRATTKYGRRSDRVEEFGTKAA